MNEHLDYLSYPLPGDVRRAVTAGDLPFAERLIARRLSDEHVPEGLKARLRFELRILRELPEAYPLTEEETLRLFRESVPDFTAEELQAYREDGTCDWIYLNGAVRYHEDCVATALRTRRELQARRTDAPDPARQETIECLRDRMMEKMKREGHAAVRFRLRTTMTVDPEAERPGETIRVHMPLPVTDAQCRAGQVRTWPDGAYVAPEDAPQRTAFWKMPFVSGTRFVTEAEWVTDAPYVRPDPALVSPEQPHFCTEEQLPQIRFTPFIRDLARDLAAGTDNPLVKARRFYDYITKECRYRYVAPYAFETCIPEHFAAGQRGDCGMHALLFISLCRASGIPAAWQSGLYTPPWGPGMHDWARFYVAPYGWLCCDGSFGGTAFREGKTDRHDFYFGNLDPWRVVYDSALQQRFDPPRLHPRYDPYDSQSPEVEYEDGAVSRRRITVHRELLLCEPF